MKHGVAKRALGVALASTLVVGSVNTLPGVENEKSKVLKAADQALYVDSTDYYNASYDEKYAYNGNDLGCTYTAEKTVFKVWSPEADSVKVNFYKTGSDDEEGAKNLGSFAMTKEDKGVWSYTYEGDAKNLYYTYRAVVDGLSYGEAVDPYAQSVGVNGDRGMVVDLDSTDPENWDKDYNSKRTAMKLSDAVVWEIDIRDFSIHASSGVSEEYRGKYKAFTESTTVNGEGKIKSCVNYLKEMGVTHVQLLPTFDFEGVDEGKVTTSLKEDNYNWGYNPKNYNSPDGAYATNPWDGNSRVKEMKEMVQALHNAGIKVIMDVVYNHTGSTANSNFNKLMPDYYYKLTTSNSGAVMYDDQSGCGNATRTQAAMFEKYMSDSLVYWADEYHIDGYRFDLMGIHDSSTMNHIRKTLDDKFGEDTILMYGEGWTGGGYDKDTSCYKDYCRKLDDGIGYFNDQIRDAVKGETGPEKVSQIGLAQQNFGLEGKAVDGEKFPANVFGGIQGSTGMSTSYWWMWRAYWSDTSDRVLAYDSCHDNMTVWDKYAESMGESFDTTSANLLNMSRMTAGYLLTSHGGMFLCGGEEFARTKNGDHNSYKSGDKVNALDWSRMATYGNLTDYYQGMIEIRKAFGGFTSVYTEDGTKNKGNDVQGFRNVKNNNLTNIPEFTDVTGTEVSQLNTYAGPDGNVEDTVTDGVVNAIGYYLNGVKEDEWSQVAVLLNNTPYARTADLTAKDGSTQWVLVSNGKQASVEGIMVTSGASVTVPGKSVVIAVPKNSFDRVAKKSVKEQLVEIQAEPKDDISMTTPAPVITPVPTTEPEQGPTELTVSSVVSPASYQSVNKNVTIKASAVSGSGEYEYRFYIYKSDSLVRSSAWSTADSFTWKPTAAGSYTVMVKVRDSEGSYASSQKSYKVYGKVKVTSLKSNKLSGAVGDSIKFTVKTSGGKSAYTYSYSIISSKGKTVKSAKNTKKNTYTWKATKKGTYSVKVTVKDALGTTATKTLKGIKIKAKSKK